MSPTPVTTETVKSADGTRIAVDRAGNGPAVVLVGAVLSTRAGDILTSPLLGELADRHTVYFYDRRGRGDSDPVPAGPTPADITDREVEDIQAVIELAGGAAALYGISSGAILAVEAARRLDGVTALVLYEPPVIVDDSRPPLPADYVEHLDELIAAGRRGDAVEYLMTAAIGVPAEFLAGMRQSPMWAGMEAVADTIAYDGRNVARVMDGTPLPADWAQITVPTLAISGSLSEPFMRTGAEAIAERLPNARAHVLEGQDHAVQPAALAPVIKDFLATK
jgi:pimeloyl-ACP methyl ester carboxylesterase